MAVVGALIFFCALLTDPYVRNWRLQQAIEQIAFDPNRQQDPPERFEAAVANEAARLGIPLRADQVRVTQTDAGTYVEARYFVHVELYLYTVDLHFRPAAGAR